MRFAVPFNLAATSLACLRPGASLSGRMTTFRAFQIWRYFIGPFARAAGVACRGKANLAKRIDAFFAFGDEYCLFAGKCKFDRETLGTRELSGPLYTDALHMSWLV